MFYNTINEKDKIGLFESKTEKQESLILNHFIATNKPQTPTDVWQRLFNCKIPLTSVRRGITNLTKKGKLKKTAQKKEGIYGMDNYLWELNI